MLVGGFLGAKEDHFCQRNSHSGGENLPRREEMRLHRGNDLPRDENVRVVYKSDWVRSGENLLGAGENRVTFEEDLLGGKKEYDDGNYLMTVRLTSNYMDYDRTRDRKAASRLTDFDSQLVLKRLLNRGKAMRCEKR